MFGKTHLDQQTKMVLLEDNESLIDRIGCWHERILHYTDGSQKSKSIKGVLNITSKRIATSVDGTIENNAFSGYGIPLQNIRMVFPLKKDKIRIQYIGYHPKYQIPIRYNKIYELFGSDSPDVCKQITNAILENTENTSSENKSLLLFPDEKIVKQVKCTSRKFEGIFYITNHGLYLEDYTKGLAFEMPYSMYQKSGLRNNTVVIQYNEMHDDGSIKMHEFEIRPNIESELVSKIIKKQYFASNAKGDHDFESLHSIFKSMSGAELKQILYQKSENPAKLYPNASWVEYTLGVTSAQSNSLQQYFGYLADEKWGDVRPKVQWCYCSNWFTKDTMFGQRAHDLNLYHINGKNRKSILEVPEKFYNRITNNMGHFHADFHFRQYEVFLIKAALLADVSIDVIGKHSAEYLEMVKAFQKDFDEHREAEMNLVKWHDKLEKFKESINNAKTKEKYLSITKSDEYVKCVEEHKKFKEIRSKYTYKNDSNNDYWDGKIEFDFNSYHWNETYRDGALKEYHTMLRKIYDEWKKKTPLQDFTDDADFTWLEWCAENVSYTTKDMVFFTNAKEDIAASLARSEAVKKSLDSFRIPEDIPKDDIFSSDCWHDKKKQMWFTRCELADKAESLAIISKDDTARKYGYFALGFPEELIEMKHNIPAISIPYDVFPGEKIPDEKRYILLSYVREEQITEQMNKDRSRIVSHIENAPYTDTFEQAGISDNDGSKKLSIAGYEKYKKTGVFDNITSSIPYSVEFRALEYITVEPREGLQNDGFNNLSTPIELPLVEKRNSLKYSFMGTDYPREQLPLYERIRKHTFKTLTGQAVITISEDYENVKKEYDELFGMSQQESQILPTVQV